MAYISVRNLTKIYQMGEVTIKALDNVSFDIDALGNISNLKIVQSSQDEQADKSALEAIINAQPFMSSKALARKDIVNVEFQFDYSASYKE